ncbi:MAG: hypothetical protein ACHQAX_03820 [Gammaproteobacteria bacterium]
MARTEKAWLEPWQTKKYAGNACIGLGLADAFASFGLFLTRKNNGETEFQWLGSDDYMVMSALMLGGLLMAWCGRSLFWAGNNEYLKDYCPTTYNSRTPSSPRNTTPSARNLHEESIDDHMQTAYRIAVAASVVFFAMSAYAFLGGFHSTPTPESHIGPHQDNKMEMSVFCLLYGMTAIISLLSTAVASSKLASYDKRMGPK